MALRKLLVTSDVSLVQSLRIAFEAEGIGAIFANEAMAPIQPMTVQVRDEDFELAHEILLGLQDT